MTPDILRKCVLVRGGLEIWIENERAEKLLELIKSPNSPKYVTINGESINTFEILGIVTPQAMEERSRRKNGQWKCMKGIWHEKSQGCQCPEKTETVTAYVEGVGEIKYKKTV